MRPHSRNVDIDRIGRICRFTKHLDLAHRLRKNSSLFLQSVRLAGQMYRYGHFDLFALCKSPQVGMNATEVWLVFPPAAGAAEGLRLEIPAAAWGGTANLKFAIPKTMMKGK